MGSVSYNMGQTLDRISDRFCNSTELGTTTTPDAAPNPADWEYFRFREGYNYIWLDVPGEEKTKELVIPFVDQVTQPGFDTPAVLNCEAPKGYRPGDLFEAP